MTVLSLLRCHLCRLFRFGVNGPRGTSFCGHVDSPCRLFRSRWLFSGCHWLPRMLHKHLVLFHLIRLQGFHQNADERLGDVGVEPGGWRGGIGALIAEEPPATSPHPVLTQPSRSLSPQSSHMPCSGFLFLFNFYLNSLLARSPAFWGQSA